MLNKYHVLPANDSTSLIVRVDNSPILGSGFALESGIAFQTKNVAYNGSISTGHVGLSIGSRYYLNDGVLSSTKNSGSITSQFVGIAISDTEINVSISE